MCSVKPVILCGGSGARLWPLSRAGFPKQFLCLTGEKSLFQLAIERLAGLECNALAVTPPLVVTNEEHRFIALDQLRETDVEIEKLLLEPVGKNTAPALTLAALTALEFGEDPILIVTPADQIVGDHAIFQSTIIRAVEEAYAGRIAVLGVPPTRPDTGYGYIYAKDRPDQDSARRVENFVEKPDALTAKGYMEVGDYYWNAGVIVLKASVWIEALGKFRPEILSAARLAWEKRSVDRLFVRPGRDEFLAIPEDSIDYAVLEHCAESNIPVVMLPLDAGWSDLGNWDTLWGALPKDRDGNAQIGDAMVNDGRNNIVYSSNRLVSLVGVDNLAVIETADAVLISSRASAQSVKQVVDTLKQLKRDERVIHRKVHRPWGWYDSVDEGARFKVKRITVKPGAALSLQRHQHRAEHWVVVKGTAEITCGDKTLTLSENQSTYIPVGELHRLRNLGEVDLEIIEVQSGSYLDEDDIVRFEDHYGR